MDKILDSNRLAQLGRELREELTSSDELAGDWIRRAAKALVEQMLAAEVDEALGRGHYRRRRDEGQAGYRNGYKGRALRTAEGEVPVEVPQVRNMPDGPYRSPIWQALGNRRSPALETLAIEMYARGLSTRDIEQLLGELGEQQEADEPRTLLSRSGVSRVTEALWAEYEAFTKRDLGEFDVVYLFCDAVYEALRRHGCGGGSAILVSWAVCSDGSRVLLHMTLGSKESSDAWLEHFRSLVSRNLPTPLTVTTDGAPGLIKAAEAMWPEAERCRCWFHKMKNVLEKVPDEMHVTIKRLLQDVRDAADYETGKQRAAALIEQYKRQLPSAMSCLAEDLEASLAHLKLPMLHRRMLRTTNLCERAFGEQRRRTKVLPRFFDEKSCLKLTFATLWRASTRWRGVRFNEMERTQLQAYIRVRQAMGKKVRDPLAA
ncbi:MAG: IS256 family transposase [Actinobacteria bacterium]|nr:IS256 family transposase [Actinomycetota bacterium]